MAQRHRQRGFIQSSSLFSSPCLALAVVTLMCAAASTTTAQQQPPPLPPLPLPLTQPQPTPTTTTTAPAIPSVPACPPALATLSPCVSYLVGNSTAPPTECCAQMRAMFQSQAPCLCAAMASGPVQQLGSALAQMLPTSCALPADACSGGTSADPTTPASGTTTPATAAAPATTGPNGVDDPTTAPDGGAGIKSVPGLLHSAAAAAGSGSGICAAALFVSSLLVVYLL